MRPHTRRGYKNLRHRNHSTSVTCFHQRSPEGSPLMKASDSASCDEDSIDIPSKIAIWR